MYSNPCTLSNIIDMSSGVELAGTYAKLVILKCSKVSAMVWLSIIGCLYQALGVGI
jgi:hypothetical protein